MSVYIRCVTPTLTLPDERWPSELPSMPRVGDMVESAVEWKGGRVVLEVRVITWRYTEAYSMCGKTGAWYAEVLLDLPEHYDREEWRDWYEGIR